VFPLRDDNPTQLLPLFTVALTAACAAVWVLVQGAGLSPETLDASVCSLGAIPAEVSGRTGAWADGPCPPGGLSWEALVTSMFLHGSWLHLVGNLWFLWIFGNNVEDILGPFRFVLFYLACGLGAHALHIASDPSSTVPTIGASGAISGVLAGYLVAFPRARVLTLVFLGFFIRMAVLPAYVIIVYWFVIQFVFALASLGGTGTGGVAWFAHVGGFLAGLALILAMAGNRLSWIRRMGPGE
jgi:membrane associated rhomboid family serine protease